MPDRVTSRPSINWWSVIRSENPQNADRFCLVVTALSNEALRQPPDFSEMPGDYLTYQDGKPLEVGFQVLSRLTYKIP